MRHRFSDREDKRSKLGLIRGSSKDVVVYVGEEERRSFRARACETRARVYICAAPFTSITLTSIIQRKSAAPRGPRFARAVHEMHPSWPAFEITEGKKRKRAAKQNCLRKKRKMTIFVPLFLLFLSTWIRFDSPFGERRFVRNLQIDRNDYIYDYIYT